MSDEEIAQENLEDTLRREETFEDKMNAGIVEGDKHFIACGECGEPVQCLPVHEVGHCPNCGRSHYKDDETGLWLPGYLRVTI